MQFTPLLSHLDSPTRHPSKVALKPSILIHNWIRDVLTIQSWLLVGAALQCFLCTLPIRPTFQFGPCLVVLALKLADNLLVIAGLKANPFMAGVIPGRHTAVLPNPDDSFTRADDAPPGGGQIAVMILSFRSNHPLGNFAPGIADMNGFAQKMLEDLDANAEKHGYLGAQNWTNADERTTSSQRMLLMYFRDLDRVHKFAHSPVHMDGWNWWARTTKKYPHIGISHEAYETPAGRWETVYDDYQPSGLGLGSVPVKKEGGTEWTSMVVDANKGRMRTHMGRLGVGSGGENGKIYGDGEVVDT